MWIGFMVAIALIVGGYFLLPGHSVSEELKEESA